MGDEEDEKLDLQDFPRPMKLPYLLPPSSATATTMQQYYLHCPLSPEHEYYPSSSSSGTSTPPLQTRASVPFKWEEQPGKPRPCTDIIPLPEPRPATKWALDPPPCSRAITKTPSPTSVLDVDEPYNVARPKFSSFRFFTEGKDQLQYSFDSSNGMMSGASPYKAAATRRGFFSKFKSGRFRKDMVGGGPELGGSLRFSISPSASAPTASSSPYTDESCTRFTSPAGKVRRNGSFANVDYHARSSHFLASIYEGLKQVIQWKGSRKQKKQGKD